MAESLASLVNVSYRYPRGKGGWALAEVTVDLPRGVVVGVLGANGAGKTTLLRLLVGQLHPTGGLLRRLPGARWGWLPDLPCVAGPLPAAAYAGVLGCQEDQLAHTLERFQVQDLWRRPGSRLSTGQRRRLELALLVAGDSEVLVLDEPASGLDPLQVNRLGALLRDQLAVGRSVVVSSHWVRELASCLDFLLVLVGGRLAFAGWQEQLRSQWPLAEPLAPEAEEFLARVVQP
ncbi:MAG: ATP-binding cassette domain-containing protein [Thermoanaerobaculum sp.]|nr:ATP-binding cassette domain-containing protein [Thermoanaerobaculum sp.]MDW7967946.1 ABC transporter ATP-binding protein [Thermoanaerobaculum sp.]